MQPVVHMRSVIRAFLNGTSCVYVEPVNRSTYVVPERNGKFFWRLLYVVLPTTYGPLDHIIDPGLLPTCGRHLCV